MNHLIRNSCILFLFIFVSQKIFSQQKPLQLHSVNTPYKIIDQIQANSAINADSAFNILSNWSAYPVIEQTGKDYMFYYTDPFYGLVPVRVYIPSSYKNKQKFPCILMLHGATGGSKFTDIDTVKKFDDDIIFSTVKKQQYIIIRPVADRSKNFNWSVNKRSFTNKNAPNLTYKTLTSILVEIKKVLDIDDNKTFALGHSDGSDGAIGFAVYNPNPFAGIVAYNSMMDNIFARDFYIRNIINSPLYIVHSDLDKLRPIQKTRIIADSLKKIDDKIILPILMT
jgi:predicted peptidase